MRSLFRFSDEARGRMRCGASQRPRNDAQEAGKATEGAARGPLSGVSPPCDALASPRANFLVSKPCTASH
jgi:hypothetical protein